MNPPPHPIHTQRLSRSFELQPNSVIIALIKNPSVISDREKYVSGMVPVERHIHLNWNWSMGINLHTHNTRPKQTAELLFIFPGMVERTQSYSKKIKYPLALRVNTLPKESGMVPTRQSGFFSASVDIACSNMSSWFPQTLDVSVIPLNVWQHSCKWNSF